MSEQLRDRVFISYSHKDKKWLQRVESMLQPLVSKGKIITWVDRKDIHPGDQWEKEIKQALALAKIAVLLVSEHFLASDYITKVELPAILDAANKKECTIFWLRIDMCRYEETNLRDFQAAHEVSYPLERLSDDVLSNTLTDIGHKIYRAYMGKQIKILSITASPDDVDDIFYEQEQDTLLNAFQHFDREDVYLDMPDPVKSTMEEIKERLADGKHDILHITAHGNINENNEGYLCFEDHRGKLEKVTGLQLAEVLQKLTPAPLIVILSSCHSARPEPGLMPAARALFEAGITAVIGMDKAVSHVAAIEFNAAFFTALCEKKTVMEAFAVGKEAIFNGEQRRLKENPNWNYIKEYEIPQLLTRDEQMTAESFSGYRIEAPGRPQSHHFQGAKYLERGFIGRRRVLRDIFNTIANKEGAVVLKGPGGIGKSTLTTRIAANLLRKGYDFIIIRGDASEAKILEAISNKAAEKGVAGAKEIYAANAEPIQKLGWYVENFLGPGKVMVIFDNFEENQDEAQGDFGKGKETLKEFTWMFRDFLKNKESFLFFSTRYMLPGFEGPDLTKDIPEFTVVEFRKMLWHGKALQRLDGKSIDTLKQEIGGNPRALELLDRIAYNEFHDRKYNWEELKDLIPELRQRIIEKKGEGDNFAPLFLDKLFQYLNSAQRLMIDVFSIYRNPVPWEAIEVQLKQPSVCQNPFEKVFRHLLKLPIIKSFGKSRNLFSKRFLVVEVNNKQRADRKRLIDLSLLESIQEEAGQRYYVHRLTAQYVLAGMEEAVRNKYHLQAGWYFEEIQDEEGNHDLYDSIESRWHYLQAGEWDQAADITFLLESYLTLHGFPQRSMELLRELEDKRLSDKNRAILFHQMGILLQEFGDYDAALTQYQQSLEIVEKIGDIKGKAVSLHQIGILYYLKGDYDTALRHYQQSLEIFEKIGNIKGKASNLHQTGRVYEDKGDYDAALRHYQQSLEIKEKIGDIKGVSSSLHHIGIIYQYKGDYDTALRHYQQSLEIFEKIGNIKGKASNLHQTGRIYEDKGDYDAALRHYQQSLEIKEKIGDIKGVSSSLHHIGIIFQLKGNYAAALRYYQQSFEIFEKIGDIKGKAISLHQIGMIYQKKGDYDAALIHYQQSLEIFEKIGDIKGVLGSLHQTGRIYEDKGDYDAALTQYQQSLEIDEKIGDIKGKAISLHQIGIIFQLKGNYDAALTQYQHSLEIREKIGDIKGKAESLHQIGMIYHMKGDYDAALTQYQQSLGIAEKIGDIKGRAASLHQIGMIYQDKGDYDAALTQYQQSLEIKEKIGDIKGVAASLHEIGMIYQDKGDYDAALIHYQQSLEIFEKIGDIAGKASSMCQMGALYLEQNQCETALKLLFKSLAIFIKIGSPNANQAKKGIARCREKMTEEQFNAILNDFNAEY